jgi:hypothetical protein
MSSALLVDDSVIISLLRHTLLYDAYMNQQVESSVYGPTALFKLTVPPITMVTCNNVIEGIVKRYSVKSC